jgi:hypothetical protein
MAYLKLLIAGAELIVAYTEMDVAFNEKELAYCLRAFGVPRIARRGCRIASGVH